MCTVLLRFDPSAPWPILLAAVRDEFLGRAWDAPGAHWPAAPSVVGGRDRVGGGTWLAVDPAAESGPAVAALLNGVRRPPPDDGTRRPTRGGLPLAALSTVEFEGVPGIADRADLAGYDGFHLLRADPSTAEVWSWDGEGLEHQRLAPGDHIIVNLGVDRDEDPLVPHFRPLLRATADPLLGEAPSSTSRNVATSDTATAWDGWVDLLRGDGLDPTDERGLIIEHEYGGERYGSTSASLVGLARDGSVRYDFTETPAAPHWYRVS